MRLRNEFRRSRGHMRKRTKSCKKNRRQTCMLEKMPSTRNGTTRSRKKIGSMRTWSNRRPELPTQSTCTRRTWRTRSTTITWLTAGRRTPLRISSKTRKGSSPRSSCNTSGKQSRRWKKCSEPRMNAAWSMKKWSSRGRKSEPNSSIVTKFRRIRYLWTGQLVNRHRTL